jgi:hypothetical protein
MQRLQKLNRIRTIALFKLLAHTAGMRKSFDDEWVIEDCNDDDHDAGALSWLIKLVVILDQYSPCLIAACFISSSASRTYNEHQCNNMSEDLCHARHRHLCKSNAGSFWSNALTPFVSLFFCFFLGRWNEIGDHVSMAHKKIHDTHTERHNKIHDTHSRLLAKEQANLAVPSPIYIHTYIHTYTCIHNHLFFIYMCM